MRKFFVTLSVGSLLFAAACGGGAEKKESTETTAEKAATTEVVEEAPAMDLAAGEAIYNGKGMCVTCHQANGQGLSPAFPPLAQADYLLEDKMRAIHQTMYGAKEPIVVNGQTYPGGVMTVVEMTDQEVVDVVNYILNSWGNDGGTVTLEEVAQVRAEAAQ